MLKSVNALANKVSKLSSQLEKAKSIMVDSYQSGFNEAVKQVQHFFVD